MQILTLIIPNTRARANQVIKSEYFLEIELSTRQVRGVTFVYSVLALFRKSILQTAKARS